MSENEPDRLHAEEADDREASAHVEQDGHEITPARRYWDHVTSVLDAAAAAYVPSLLLEGMTEDELIERFRQAMAQPQRIIVLPPSESEREQDAAYCICDPDDVFDPDDPKPRAVEGCPAHKARRVYQLWADAHMGREQDEDGAR